MLLHFLSGLVPVNKDLDKCFEGVIPRASWGPAGAC